MSDDVITTFLQSRSTVETKKSPDKLLEENSQGADFKEVISQEEKKLSVARRQLEDGNQAENENPTAGEAATENVLKPVHHFNDQWLTCRVSPAF